MRNWFRPEHDHKDLAGQNDYTKFRDIDFAAYVTDLTTGRTEQRNRDISTASVAGDYFGCDALVFDGNLDRSVIAAAKETKNPAILAGSSPILAADGKKPSTMPRRNPTAEPPTRNRSYLFRAPL